MEFAFAFLLYSTFEYIEVVSDSLLNSSTLHNTSRVGMG